MASKGGAKREKGRIKTGQVLRFLSSSCGIASNSGGVLKRVSRCGKGFANYPEKDVKVLNYCEIPPGQTTPPLGLRRRKKTPCCALIRAFSQQKIGNGKKGSLQKGSFTERVLKAPKQRYQNVEFAKSKKKLAVLIPLRFDTPLSADKETPKLLPQQTGTKMPSF